MRKLFPILALAFLCNFSYATIWNVDVGGGPGNGSPYYAPQHLTIQQGDTVLWTWSSGTHNVTSTSGPVSFASPNQSTPATYQFVFTVPGVYEYECTLFSHAQTQFGSITVEAPLNVEPSVNDILEVGPNPLQNSLRVHAPGFLGQFQVRMYEAATGRLVSEQWQMEGDFDMGVGFLPRGNYLLELSDGERRLTKVVTKN